ncbi:MAG TPA: endolytic transglycosylase MltG [Solirubrobacteraceae bacterium]
MSRGNRSEQGHERTAQERERDRLERERRRAEREGVQTPTPTPQLPPDHQATEPLAATEQLPPEPIEPEPEAPAWHVDTAAVPVAPEPPMQVEQPLVAESVDHEQGEAHGRHDEQFEIELHEEHVLYEDDEEHEPLQPPAARRAESIAPLALPQRGRGRRGAGSGGTGPPRMAGARSSAGGRRFTRARIAALLALAVAIAFVWFLLSLFQPFAGDGHGKVIVQIPKGSSSSKIGSILDKDGVVSSGFFFNIRATLEGKRGSLHSGRFQLQHDMSYSAAIDALSKPPPKVIVEKVVIPEGYTRRQIAELVHEDALSGDYLAASERSRLLNPRHYGAPKGTDNLEGFLFPATYELRAGVPVQRLVDEQLVAFRRRFGSADVRRAHELGVTSYEMLTVASLIEREAQTEHDRPLIAAVIYNRLHEGIPIGIDAAIYYAVELQKGIATYTGELTQSMLKIDSPYNTRTHKGLPPTPISNPGEASIHAAAHPAHVPYLYYVAGADGCGEQVFSKTEAEFEKNVAAYDAAVKKNGGHPPACKKK